MHRLLHTTSPSFFLLLTVLLAGAACQEATKSRSEAIIDQAIQAHGGTAFDTLQASFDFRDIHMEVFRRGGTYQYMRTYVDSVAPLAILRNDGLHLTMNGQPVAMSEKDSLSMLQQVNSVVYFALLPYFLNDSAVRSEYLGQAQVMGQPYDKVRVTFAEEGGGVDHEDVYCYWFHAEDHTMDYLAYSYSVNGGGTRFREAYNARRVGGILWQDYHNYGGPPPGEVPIEQFDSLFAQDLLEKVSEINLRNIRVE